MQVLSALDRYMYARAGHSTLLTAIYDHNTTHCLQYRRHMRSHTAGHFVLFYQHTDMVNVPPSYVTLTDTKQLIKKKVSGNKLDIWLVVINVLLFYFAVQCMRCVESSRRSRRVTDMTAQQILWICLSQVHWPSHDSCWKIRHRLQCYSTCWCRISCNCNRRRRPAGKLLWCSR